MFAVGIRRELRARHSLGEEFGPEEAVPHGHAYVVEWRCSAAALDGHGFAMDIALMERVLEEVLGSIAGSYLNELPFFRQRPVSVENLALHLHGRLMDELASAGMDRAGLAGSEVVVWESQTAWASYRE